MEFYEEMTENFISNYDVTKGKEIIFHGDEDDIFQITDTQKESEILEKNNNTKKLAVIDLGQCVDILKNYYKINENVSLIIIKYQRISNISSERSLQYEVYEPYNKTKLNLSICDNATIDVYIPVVLSEEIQELYNQLKDLGYDLFDINSPFYQDICTQFKSPDGTDVPLSGRINYYYNNAETL